ncbi:MAG: FAD-dependent thymidylate synthase [Candidatus Woesearchaeota archaeon]
MSVPLTKRLTVQSAEDILRKEQKFLNHGFVRLVDYMGGDAAIINAATGFRGCNFLGIDKKDFMLYLRQNRILYPFQFAEIKLHVALPIWSGSKVVSEKDANVNEYSLRYSAPTEEMFNPLAGRVDAKCGESIMDFGKQMYNKLVDEMDFTRELARVPLSMSQYTYFYWKINLESAFEFLKNNPKPSTTLAPFVESLRNTLRAVAPIAYEAYQIIDEEKQIFSHALPHRVDHVAMWPKQLTNPYSQTETARFTNPEAEKNLFSTMPLLNHGSLTFFDYMGGDNAIVQAARTSYGEGIKKRSEDDALINYLITHDHNTPLEMVEFAFHLKLPFFVKRQLIRHRTIDCGSFLDSDIVYPNDFYIPKESDVRAQSATNKQGRDENGIYTPESLQKIYSYMNQGYGVANFGINNVVSDPSEIERVGLFATMGHFTDWTIKSDLHNFFHFLQLRADSHAQKEAQYYATAIKNVIAEAVPVAYASFENNRVQGLKLSGNDIRFITQLVQGSSIDTVLDEISSRTGKMDFTAKLERLGLYTKGE